MIPDGIWCSTNSPAPVSTVWPALAPPWYRTTRSARSASTSTIFPLPSSPHWAPTTTTQWVFGPNMAPQQKRPKSGALQYPPTEARPVLLARQRALRGRARQCVRPSRTHTAPSPGSQPGNRAAATPRATSRTPSSVRRSAESRGVWTIVAVRQSPRMIVTPSRAVPLSASPSTSTGSQRARRARRQGDELEGTERRQPGGREARRHGEGLALRVVMRGEPHRDASSRADTDQVDAFQRRSPVAVQQRPAGEPVLHHHESARRKLALEHVPDPLIRRRGGAPR